MPIRCVVARAPSATWVGAPSCAARRTRMRLACGRPWRKHDARVAPSAGPRATVCDGAYRASMSPRDHVARRCRRRAPRRGATPAATIAPRCRRRTARRARRRRRRSGRAGRHSSVPAIDTSMRATGPRPSTTSPVSRRPCERERLEHRRRVVHEDRARLEAVRLTRVRRVRQLVGRLDHDAVRRLRGARVVSHVVVGARELLAGLVSRLRQVDCPSIR